MNESADLLFHFTEKYESAVSIMNDKFKPFFCVENFSYMYKNDDLIIALPAVCFCDIPIERQKKHKENYGKYGIGLTKEWGIKNNLNIVNYSFVESLRSSSYRILINEAKTMSANLSPGLRNAINILLMTTKPYNGRKYCKDNKSFSTNEIRFYDEREWRYIPLVNNSDWIVALENDDYNKLHANIENLQSEIHKRYKLNFSVDDIRYIFLRSIEEIDQFLNDIRNNYTESDILKIRELIVVE